MAAKPPPASVISKLAPPPVPAATPDGKSPAAATPVSKKKKEEPPPLLKPAQTIAAASGNHYVVDKMLGKGGFGEVYLVSALKNPDKQFAMKVEPNDHPKKKMLRLKIEIHVFDMLKTVSAGFNSTHFVRMHDKGITKTFKYYVMDLIWLSLKDVCDDIIGDVPLCPSTLITIARQTLKSIEALHELGFLHRDIKAANFAVGRPPNEHIIYLLDFGVARPYKDPSGKVKVARERVPFMGTPRYASIRSMENLEQCRKDDLEVWSYMMLEFHDVDFIFWYKEPNRTKILESKKYLYSLVDDSQMSTYNRIGFLAKYPKFPTEYFDIMNQIYRMNYECPGPFLRIENILKDKVAKAKIDMNVPLEWVGKKPKSPEKPKKEEKKEDKKDAKKEEKKEKKEENKVEKSEMKKVEKEEKKPKEEAKKVENKKEVKEVKHDTKKGRKKASKKKKEIEEVDEEEVITMEIMLEELKREKRRREKMREAEEYQDEGNSDDDSEEDRRSPVSPSPRRARKKKSKIRPRDNSDRDQRDDDRRDDSRRRKSGRRRKKSRPSRRIEVNEEDSEKNVAKTPEKDSIIVAQPVDDGEYMQLGDVNEMEAQDAKKKKDKMGGDPKKQPPSSDKK